MKINKAREKTRQKDLRTTTSAGGFFSPPSFCRTDFILSLQACGLQRGCHVVKITAESKTRDSTKAYARSLRECACLISLRAEAEALMYTYAYPRMHARAYVITCVHRSKGKLTRARPRMEDASLLCDSARVTVNLSAGSRLRRHFLES